MKTLYIKMYNHSSKWTWKKKNPDPLPHITHKINSSWITVTNVKGKTIKASRRKQNTFMTFE